jgi:phosphoribosylformimino-5-aminoimidazole carboxamide ribotide isomerase
VTGLRLWPSIDLQEGRVVRLLRGELASVTVYEADPVETVRRFAAEGADGVHVVDLDAAFGRGENRRFLPGIVAAAGAVPVQVGGGVRSPEDVDLLLDAGVARVVVGSLPFTAPETFARVMAWFGERIVLALDCKGGRPAIRGWTEDAGAGTLADVLPRFEAMAVRALLVTDVSKDGAMEGPSTRLLREARRLFAGEILASGGIRGEEDLPAVDAALAGSARGAILGKALHDGTTTVARLRAALGRGGSK